MKLNSENKSTRGLHCKKL